MLVLRIEVHRRHFGLAAIIMVAVIACASSVQALNIAFAKQIDEINQDAKREVTRLKDGIADIKQEKESEKVLAKLIKADKKRRAEEAAKRKAAELAAQQAGQVVTPADCAISGAHGNPNQIDVVINKKHCFNPINFVPSDLVSYQGYLVSNKIYSKLVAMFSAASAAGRPLSLTSTYRSYSDQVVTYNNWVAVNGSTAAADTVSARPGYSEHQTGLAMDIKAAGGAGLESFASTQQYTWMKNNAYKYGFVQRYQSGYESITGYSAEPWHWRYVGVTVATDMYLNNVHTLEQYWAISGGGY